MNGKWKSMMKIFKLLNINAINVISFDILLYAFLHAILFLSLVILAILLLWFCYDHSFRLNEISSAMPAFIGSCQILSVSISLIRNSETLLEIVNHIQVTVEKRKIPLIHVKYLLLEYLVIDFYPGCEESMAAYTTYEKCEAKNASTATILIKAIIADLIIMYSIAPPQPISYLDSQLPPTGVCH